MSGASAPSPTDLGVLASGLAHEIRNRLTTIRFNVYIIRNAPSQPKNGVSHSSVSPAAGQTSDRGTNEGIATPVQHIVDEVERLEGVLREFLLLARPESPQIELVQMGNLLKSVMRMVDGPCRSQKIELSCECSPEVWGAADPKHLKQALLNLLLNAQEAMPQGGRIRLRGYLESDRAVVEVADTGPGISKEVQAKILQPFFSTKKEGMGLGLSICQRLIEQMNGALEFHTGVGQGTTFVVSLHANLRLAVGRTP
jgi:signal transduction histidine kinase